MQVLHLLPTMAAMGRLRLSVHILNTIMGITSSVLTATVREATTVTTITRAATVKAAISSARVAIRTAREATTATTTTRVVTARVQISITITITLPPRVLPLRWPKARRIIPIRKMLATSPASSAPITTRAATVKAAISSVPITTRLLVLHSRQEGGYRPRQQRPYNNQGGYQQRQYGNRQQEGGYRPRQQRPYNNQGGGYQQRQGGYQNRQGGYNRQNRQQGGAFPRQGKSFTPRPKRIDYEMPVPDPNEQIRLNKFMANAGLCSRREADEFIQKGMVKVNGVVATELGTKISHSDVVEFNEKVVTLERKCYILLNKPKDCVTTSDDPNGRTTVLDLVKGACEERIYPVGRLDRNTTGVLLLTNDGDLASKLTHPKYVKKKIYHVWCDKDIAEDDMQRIADGIELEDGPIHADAISYATETDRNQAGIEIHSGRNRIVRRIFESLGYHVTKLDRVYFAGLTKKNLPRGRWRYLTQDEVNFLKMGSFE